MQKNAKAIAVIFLSIWLTGCSKSVDTSTSAGCGRVGFFASEGDCQNNVNTGCSTTTIQSDGQNLVCWQALGGNGKTTTPTPTPRYGTGTTTTSNGNTTANTGAVSGPGCTGPIQPWSASAWVPAVCKTGVGARSRSFSCGDLTCGCQGSQPANEINICNPDLFLAKHYAADCTDAKGSVISTAGARVCYFITKYACIPGWTKHSTGPLGVGINCY